ncbi:TBC domain protein [Drechmeria coniospora]|uniref:TBC domain protein n=1 Tax=Drechmeria coniospora TaxID=98403 RepID=A0A151GDT0_DRECN|nr:TBC domain protein [Drechmeria coniospora]KYK55257.1 TBC domain protein [Drechmeria coniospora]
MLPMRFASVRQKSRPALSRPSFLDDPGLVAVRYENTKQAEPPIPLPPPRSPLRIPSEASSSRSISTTTTTTHTPSSPISSPCSSPVVVAPPPSHLPFAAAPPTEQHPALRRPPLAATARAVEDGKRDSGHARTSTSTATIDEACEEFGVEHDEKARAELAALVASAAAAARGGQEQHVEHPSPAGQAKHRPAAAGEPRAAEAAGAPPTTSAVAATAPSTPSPSCREMPRFPSSEPRAVLDAHYFSSPAPTESVRARVRRSEEAPTTPRTVAPMPMQPQPLLRGSAPPVSSRRQPQARQPSPNGPRSDPSTPPKTPSFSSFEADDDADGQFSPLVISIPTDTLIDHEFMAGFSFSKRGSIIFRGQRAMAADGAASPSPGSLDDDAPPPRVKVSPSDVSAAAAPPPDIRLLSADVEKESQKVRSLYQAGDALHWEDGARHSFCERLEPTPEMPTEESTDGPPSTHHLASGFPSSPSAGSSLLQQRGSKRDSELAGGIEDWEDVDGADVDRYGFINPSTPRIGPPTELKSAQHSPRRRAMLQKRDPMGFSSHLGGGRLPSRKVSARSLNTQNSEMSVASRRSSRSVIRQAGNLLPHNRNRRWMDEAGDMLTVSPNLQDAVEEAQVGKLSEALKRKEWERSEKWHKMAKVVRSPVQGHGMGFEFDVRSPKLIERTWKGIPDRWRAAAWWSFLATSAREHEGSPSAEEIMGSFHRLQQTSSPDDVQIDLDVPRTINRHIMFRRRYRGGQRLLFRVLHALSIYFPETGYVQGMASLAATLLCYFDEDKCFVMLVWMWRFRGLDRLYRPGFDGLMAALREFETHWLDKDVASNLADLCVDPTAYGTRWYLTLFNLSIPFPAQLRVWDVFLLLGVDGQQPSAAGATDEGKVVGAEAPTGLDVLHATSAALVQALREVLVDSDFENAMKALTSWIPVKDEDLLMKVTKAEWKTHQSRRKT